MYQLNNDNDDWFMLRDACLPKIIVRFQSMKNRSVVILLRLLNIRIKSLLFQHWLESDRCEGVRDFSRGMQAINGIKGVMVQDLY